VIYLSAEQVREIHEDQLERYGGAAGGGHRGAAYEGVEAAVQAVKNSYYDTVEELAAAYAVYIVQGHVFADGNKRTGCASMLTFLAMNGRPLPVASEGLARTMIEMQAKSEAGARTDELVTSLARLLQGDEASSRS
jgi:death-on-curing protein